jgi:hypothetical protein
MKLPVGLTTSFDGTPPTPASAMLNVPSTENRCFKLRNHLLH